MDRTRTVLGDGYAFTAEVCYFTGEDDAGWVAFFPHSGDPFADYRPPFWEITFGPGDDPDGIIARVEREIAEGVPA